MSPNWRSFELRLRGWDSVSILMCARAKLQERGQSYCWQDIDPHERNKHKCKSLSSHAHVTRTRSYSQFKDPKDGRYDAVSASTVSCTLNSRSTDHSARCRSRTDFLDDSGARKVSDLKESIESVLGRSSRPSLGRRTVSLAEQCNLPRLETVNRSRSELAPARYVNSRAHRTCHVVLKISLVALPTKVHVRTVRL